MITKNRNAATRIIRFGSYLISLLLFWLIVSSKIPYSFTQILHTYSFGLFLVVLALYFVVFLLPDRYRWPACLGLTLLLFSLTLSFMWTSGLSDNKVIAGFLPYKDGGGYYQGANLLLNGMPLESTLQSGWRPLFSGFLASTLFLVGGNLQMVLAILVLLAALAAYSASRPVFDSLGALPASLFITSLYFYIQPLIGLTMTELLGFTLGCFAFSLLWTVNSNLKLADLILGLLTLLLAMSVRAGAFFILPLLALWAGRIFRGWQNFSWRTFGIALTAILTGYLAANSLYVRLVGVPEGTVFGNFAYSLYGQVQGGRGWHWAIEELQTRDPAIIYRAAFQFFLDHPFSLLIGVAKSYRDFFLPGPNSIFVFDVHRPTAWSNYLVWGITAFLLIRGLLYIIKNISSNIALMLAAGFAGVFLSIPFLPPIDGGSRFYAATVPFIFALPAIGLSELSKRREPRGEKERSDADRRFLYTGSIVLSLLTVVTPVMILKLAASPPVGGPSCLPEEETFSTWFHPGSHVDLIVKDKVCGLAPDICFHDFDKNGTEKSVDDFYQEIHALAQESGSDVRIAPAINLMDGNLKYFFLSADKFPAGIPYGHIIGCAERVRTRNQTIYLVESILPNPVLLYPLEHE